VIIDIDSGAFRIESKDGGITVQDEHGSSIRIPYEYVVVVIENILKARGYASYRLTELMRQPMVEWKTTRDGYQHPVPMSTTDFERRVTEIVRRELDRAATESQVMMKQAGWL
jgi:hypothetical protein